MFLSYVFLKKFKDADYYDIINVVNMSVAKSQFMILDGYNLAFRIDNAAIKLYENSKKDGKIVLVSLKDKTEDIILPEDLLILDLKEFQELRKIEIEKKVEINKDDFMEEDLYFEYIFEEEKKNILEKALNQWFPAINMIYIMYIFDLIEAQTILYSNGYLITDANKEDIFIEIIEKDQDDLIEVLEKYIEAKDEIYPVFNSFKFFKKLKEEFDEISYWDFDNYEEAKVRLYEISGSKDPYDHMIKHSAEKSNKELFKEIYNKYIKEKKED